MNKATEVVPCVTVTEEHWKAMIDLQKTQIALLEQIRDTLPSLATKEELTAEMDQQIDILTKYSDACRDETAEFQVLLKELATDTENRMTTASREYHGTGWKSERELFEEYIFGEGNDGSVYEEAHTHGFDTDGDTRSLGSDTALLFANLVNIVDEDAYVEDCTTRHYAPSRKKKEQQSGPVMGGM